jgi:molybdopterin synthase catalytic subunit
MIKVQYEDFDVGLLQQDLQRRAHNPGAVAAFTGLVREHYSDEDRDGNRVLSLELEHYPGMTEKSLESIARQAAERWSVQACTIIHRVGRLSVGDRIVYVGVASTHRGDAFAAAEFIMDYLKTSAPFWKKQHRVEGAEWVETRSSDTEAARRWAAQES